MRKYSTEFYVGMDLGDASNHICILDPEGEVVEATEVSNTIDEINAFFDRFAHRSKVVVAMETGTHSPWLSHLLEGRGFEVLVGNARKLRLVWDSSQKDDPRDAELLARMARFDRKLLSPIHHRSRSAHMDLTVIKGRDALVRCRTKLINFVRGICKSAGVKPPSCSAEAFPKVVISHIPEDLLEAAVPCVNTVMELTIKIRQFDRKIEAMCKERYPETMALRDIAGVGPVTALAFVLTLEDPDRFKKSRDVGPYLGLTPKRDKSGKSDKPLSITKEGNSHLRSLLVGAAHYILGPFGRDCDLRYYGMRIASRGGKVAKRKGVVAVARKLAVLMHHLWKNHATYDPMFQQSRRKAA